MLVQSLIPEDAFDWVCELFIIIYIVYKSAIFILADVLCCIILYDVFRPKF